MQKWLTFDNKLVLEILVKACRPRTRKQCAKQFIMFLSVAIPQKFKVNADNFSREFYKMMKSLHDLDHLSALFMKDSSIRTQNKATVPVEGFGTRDNLGLIQVWILSLGIQKEAFLQLLGATSYSDSKRYNLQSSTYVIGCWMYEIKVKSNMTWTPD